MSDQPDAPTEAETAEQMKRLSDAIMETINAHMPPPKASMALAALGAIAGCVAHATGKPDTCMHIVTAAMRGVITGELLD